MQTTVGRKVWLWGAAGALASDGQPFDATVVFVHTDWCVNVKYTDHAGVDHYLPAVSLGVPRMPASANEVGVNAHGTLDNHGSGIYATWMPYQMREAQRVGSLGAGPHPVHTGVEQMNWSTSPGDPALAVRNPPMGGAS
jgi:hypothetical protein